MGTEGDLGMSPPHWILGKIPKFRKKRLSEMLLQKLKIILKYDIISVSI
jgi:hypothetical protein